MKSSFVSYTVSKDIISALNSEQQVKNDSMGGLKLSMNEVKLFCHICNT